MKLRTLAVVAALTMPVSAVVSPVEAHKTVPCHKWHSALKKAGLPVTEFSYIMYRESKCVAKAVGWNYRGDLDHTACPSGAFHRHRQCHAVRSWDMGLLQINSQFDTLTRQVCGASTRSRILLQPSCNLRVAKYLYDRHGLAPWRGSSN
jgi:hypothetical protein